MQTLLFLTLTTAACEPVSPVEVTAEVTEVYTASTGGVLNLCRLVVTYDQWLDLRFVYTSESDALSECAASSVDDVVQLIKHPERRAHPVSGNARRVHMFSYDGLYGEIVP